MIHAIDEMISVTDQQHHVSDNVIDSTFYTYLLKPLVALRKEYVKDEMRSKEEIMGMIEALTERINPSNVATPVAAFEYLQIGLYLDALNWVIGRKGELV